MYDLLLETVVASLAEKLRDLVQTHLSLTHIHGLAIDVRSFVGFEDVHDSRQHHMEPPYCLVDATSMVSGGMSGSVL